MSKDDYKEALISLEKKLIIELNAVRVLLGSYKEYEQQTKPYYETQVVFTAIETAISKKVGIFSPSEIVFTVRKELKRDIPIRYISKYLRQLAKYGVVKKIGFQYKFLSFVPKKVK